MHRLKSIIEFLILLILDFVKMIMLLPRQYIFNHRPSLVNISNFSIHRLRYVKNLETKVYNYMTNFVVINPNFLISFLYIFKFKVNLILSSDSIIKIQKSRIDLLKSLNFQVFVWNNEHEIINIVKHLEVNRLRLISYFSNFLSENQFDLDIYVCKPKLFVKKSSPVRHKYLISFAGQVNPELFMDEILLNNQALDIFHFLKNEIGQKSLDFFFGSSIFDESNLDLETFVKVRHTIINLYRIFQLKQIEEIFGANLLLIGSDFSSRIFPKALIMPSKKNLTQLYRECLINLDLGSQSGVEYVYPRSIEISAQNEFSLASIFRGNTERFSNSFVWHNAEELKDFSVDRNSYVI